MKKTNDVRFSYDFIAKTIIGTKASFDKASKGFGPVYEELADKMAKQPTFKCVVKAPKQPAKVKQTYKGMDIPFMVDFLTAMEDYITLKTLNDTIAYAKKNKESKYPLAKRVFFDTYDSFDFVDAKRIVDEYRHQQTLEKANAMAAALEAVNKKTTDEDKAADMTTAA